MRRLEPALGQRDLDLGPLALANAGFTAERQLRRSNYGIDFGILFIGADRLALADNVKFELDLKFIEPSAGDDP